MGQRLQATAVAGQLRDFTAGGDADPAELMRADLAEDSNGFHDVLLSLLLNRRFAFSKLQDGTVEDWLWFRLHSLHSVSGVNEQSPAFTQHLEALRQHVLTLPPSHYDPMPSGQQASGSGLGARDAAGLLALGEMSAAAGLA